MRIVALLCLLILPHLAQAQVPDIPLVSARAQRMVDDRSLAGAHLVLMQDGRIILDQSFGGYTAATQVPIASATKWLSTTAIARLVDRGVMQWSNTIGQYLPSAPPDTRAITLGQLLSHTSGIRGDDPGCLGNSAADMQACVDQILALPLQYAPGTRFAYGGNSFQVAGRMAEIATGLSWDQIFINEVVEPLGLTRTDYAFTSTAQGYVRVNNPRIAGGARAIAHDYLRVVEAHAGLGVFRGQRYLSEAMVRDMQRDQTFGVPILNSPDPDAFGYGYGEWRNLVDTDSEAVQTSSQGAFGFSPWLDNELGLAGVLLVRTQLSLIRADVDELWALTRATLLADPLFANDFE